MYFLTIKNEFVGNYYSGGTLKRLAVHHGLFKVLAGDLSHSRPVNRCVRPLSLSLLLGLSRNLACVSQKTRKRLGPENRPVKLPKRLSGVSQSARKTSSLKNTSFSPVNFMGTHYLPKRVFGTVFLYLVNKMASADILFRAKQTAKALHKKREN